MTGGPALQPERIEDGGELAARAGVHSFGELAWQPAPSRWVRLVLILHACYLAFLLAAFRPGATALYVLLVLSALFHFWQLASFCHTVTGPPANPSFDPEFTPGVDVFVATAGEGREVVEPTLRAALGMDYPDFQVYLLNDGYVAGAENWREIERLARDLGVEPITRTVAGGAKAGNINHALRLTKRPFVSVLDVDHTPHPRFLSALMGHLADPALAFVQSPQFYGNRFEGPVPAGSWEQQELFFGTIMRGKAGRESAFFCGTNAVLRRAALEQVGGLLETNVAEDFATSVRLHAAGWKSAYVPGIYAIGLGPEDMSAYCRQQFRWASGSLATLFDGALWSRGGLTAGQRVQYLSSIAYYCTGVFTVIDLTIPLVLLFTDWRAFAGPGIALLAFFFPIMTATLVAIRRWSGGALTYRSVSFSLSSFHIQLAAVASAVCRHRGRFVVTPKRQGIRRSIWAVAPHWMYAFVLGAALAWAINREGASLFVCANALWALAYVAMFAPFIEAALAQGSGKERHD
jgi:cellulose synthase (UDP-forming)